MGWWDTFTQGVTDYITTGSTGTKWVDFAANTGLGYALNKSGVTDSFQPQIPAVGYQGGIPNSMLSVLVYLWMTLIEPPEKMDDGTCRILFMQLPHKTE